MKVRVEIDARLAESEVVIRCPRLDESVQRIQQYALEQAAGRPAVVFYKGDREFYFPIDEVLFFETEGEAVYAHTSAEAFRIRLRLYELEEFLPRSFVRVSKSAIANTAKIYSIQRDLTAASRVEFSGTHKSIYASRRYYGALRERMNERSKGQ